MKKKAIIVAAGSGNRMKAELPKQFLLINGRPLLYYTIQPFISVFDDIEIVLVLPAMHINKGVEIIDGFFDASRFIICEGGDSRFESVRNGLKHIEEECVVLVHDGARCLVSPDLIRSVYHTALTHGTAVPVVACRDSVRMVNSEGNESCSRDALRLVQTPQAFHSKIIVPAYDIPFKENFTDEATVVEAYGIRIALVQGEEENLKVTTPIDLIIAEKLLSDQFPD